MGLGMCPDGYYTSADADCVNHMPQLATGAIVSKGVKKSRILIVVLSNHRLTDKDFLHSYSGTAILISNHKLIPRRLQPMICVVGVGPSRFARLLLANTSCGPQGERFWPGSCPGSNDLLGTKT